MSSTSVSSASSSEVASSDLVSLPPHVAVLVVRLHHAALPAALHPAALPVTSLAPLLDAKVLAATHALVARRASLAEVRAAASAVDATLEPLAVAMVAAGLTTLRQPLGPAGGTISQVRRLRPMGKLRALRSLLALISGRGDGVDVAVTRTGAALTRLADALEASARTASEQERAATARDAMLDRVQAAIRRLRRHAAVALEDQPERLAELFAELPVERRPARRKKLVTRDGGGSAVPTEATSPA